MNYIILVLAALAALALCEVITATILVVGMAHMSDFKRELNTESDVLNILAGNVADLKNDIHKNRDIPRVIREKIPRNAGYVCDLCIYGPPSSSDGKPCSACDPDNPFTNCFQGKEELMEQYKVKEDVS